jgi:hypothetical protein
MQKDKGNRMLKVASGMMPVDLLAVSRYALQSRSASDQISATYPTLSIPHLLRYLFLVLGHIIAYVLFIL